MSIVDPSAIENLKALAEKTGKDICNQLVELFINTTPEVFQKMDDALKEKDFKTFGREAHSLKSSSGNLGAQMMSEKCLKIEHAICEENCVDVEQLSMWRKELEEVFSNSVVEIKKIAG